MAIRDTLWSVRQGGSRPYLVAGAAADLLECTAVAVSRFWGADGAVSRIGILASKETLALG